MNSTTNFPRATFQRQVLDRLGQDICSGKYQPGQILPSESELCERFSFSRIVIREAIKSLAAKGMLEVRRKVGTLVLGPAQWNLFDADIIAWRTLAAGDDRQMSQDLMELRRIVEPAAARFSAMRASDEELRGIRAAFEQMVRAVAGESDYVAADLAFHSAIFESCGNQFILQMRNALAGVLRRGFEIVSQKPGGPAGSLSMHQALCERVVARDGEGAERAAFALIELATADLQDCLASADTPAAS